MEAGNKRWVEVTPSEYAHEQGGLAAIRELLPDTDPYRAWSNFTFTTRSGRQYEVDLLVIGRAGIYLLELKHWSGTISGDHQTWFHNRRPEDNPRLLTDLKAKHFKQLLVDVSGATRVPFVHAGVVLHQPGAQVQLTDRGRAGVYRIDGQGPAGLEELLADLVARPPRDSRDLVDRQRSVQLAKVIERAGVRRSVRHRTVGNLLLDDNPLAEGPGWQDYLARHTALDRVRRVRFYIRNARASDEEKMASLRAARREFGILENVSHPGIGQAIEFYEHERGPAVVFAHDPSEVRLDHFLAARPNGLTIENQLDLVRALADTLGYAHRRKLVHRRLSPRSVFVRPMAQERLGVRVRDWHTALRMPPATQGSYVPGTRTLEDLTDTGVRGFLAPETLHKQDADPVLADVFGLGALAYMIFTGLPPADSGEALQQILAQSGGLDISAAMDGAPQAMVNLVREATAGDTDLRLQSVGDFVREFTKLVAELSQPEEAAERVDPFDAKPGQRIGTDDEPTRFEVLQRLDQGSTALALLVRDERRLPGHDANRDTVRGESREVAPKRAEAVLKVALDEDAARRRLLDEAEVLPQARDTRIAQLLEGPLVVGGRTALLLEDAGRESLAAMIKREGRLSLDLLERWGKDLLEILVSLDLAGVNHRDIKPDNLAFRELGKSRQVHLTLFDFSLSRAPLEHTGVGTAPYLDPFFDRIHRPRFDAAAERYAAAVTLYEMATGQTPEYGEGNRSHPAVISSDVTIDPALFEPTVGEGLSRFFAKALARDPKSRHDTIESMHTEWRSIFAAVPPAAGDVPAPGAAEPVAGEELDERAAAATLETPIAAAGLTPRAVDALHRVDVRTVADLLARSPFDIARLSGVSEPTRREVRRRAKQWRARLRPGETATPPTEPIDVPLHSVDGVLTSLLPKTGRADSSASAVMRTYLGFAGDHGLLIWPTQAEIAQLHGVTAGRVGQIAPQTRKSWPRNRALTEVRTEIVDLVSQAGGVVAASDVAESLLTARGSLTDGRERLSRALGLVRAVVDVEGDRGAEARLLTRRCFGTVILALEVPDNPEAVPGTDLLDYAVRLGRAADKLAAEESLPSAAHCEARLREVRLAPGMAPLSPVRLAALAAAASERAAANGRGEVYPAGLDPVRALRQLASSLAVVRHGLDVDQLRARVRARYPQVGELPDRPRLDALLRVAEVPLVFSDGRYLPRDRASSGLATGHGQTSVTRLGGVGRDRNLAAFEQRLTRSIAEHAFVTLAVDWRFHARAAAALAERFGVTPVDVTADLLAAMRREAEEHQVDWSLVLRSDRPDAAPQDAANLRTLVAMAAASLESRLEAETRPLLIVEAAPLARYDRLAVLERLADQATARPAARWLLLPVEQDGVPSIDGRPAPGALGALRLSTTWITRPRDEAVS
ncbi:BREX system serine/threonine kinase PglW [Sphaerisporangium siamense]|uniref:non-specific serine/threonine protein kinase n=1 Tax=Sphaerisporangium siamense TaxID=795645 RepID=A0A7W7DFR1_9ACTN|nr:BREX system serine/threonine kinase PglW [Sphaerisporangium siamense]MBB4705170.1 serine/threonine protein kinase [Sphaerisporangium siamense]